MKDTIYPKGSGIKIRPITNFSGAKKDRAEFGESYLVTVPARVTGSGRIRRQFTTKREAEDFAGEQFKGTKQLGEEFFLLSSEERRDAVAALNIIRPHGLTLLTCATQCAEAHKKLGGRPLSAAVEYFVNRNPASMPRKTTDEVFKDLLAAKRADGASNVYLKDLEVRLQKFVDAFPGMISDVTATALTIWLRTKLKCGPRARNNYRRAVGTLLSFAEAQDYLPKDFVDFEKVAKAREAEMEIEIFTPQEMSKLITAASMNPNDLPAGFNRRYASGDMLLLLVLGAFAGLRTAEIERQRWEDINLQRGFIRVTAAKGNTAQKRLVTIRDNLKAWLSRYRKDAGPVCEIARTPDAIARLAKRAGVEWKHNALRHSFISYFVAESQDVARASLQAGNSPQMIHRHYREIVTPEEAKAWFAIQPEIPSNVILKTA